MKEKQDDTGSSMCSDEMVDSVMLKIWGRQEVKDVKSAMEQMHWKSLTDIQEVWTSVNRKEESGILEFEKSFEALLERIDEEMKKQFQYHKEKKESISQKKKTNSSQNQLNTIENNLSTNIEEYQEKQTMKLEYKDITECRVAKDFLEEIKTRWNRTESEIEDMQDQIWPALEDDKLKSALERMKLVYAKEKQKVISTIEMIKKV